MSNPPEENPEIQRIQGFIHDMKRKMKASEVLSEIVLVLLKNPEGFANPAVTEELLELLTNYADWAVMEDRMR